MEIPIPGKTVFILRQGPAGLETTHFFTSNLIIFHIRQFNHQQQIDVETP